MPAFPGGGLRPGWAATRGGVLACPRAHRCVRRRLQPVLRRPRAVRPGHPGLAVAGSARPGRRPRRQADQLGGRPGRAGGVLHGADRRRREPVRSRRPGRVHQGTAGGGQRRPHRVRDVRGPGEDGAAGGEGPTGRPGSSARTGRWWFRTTAASRSAGRCSWCPTPTARRRAPTSTSRRTCCPTLPGGTGVPRGGDFPPLRGSRSPAAALCFCHIPPGPPWAGSSTLWARSRPTLVLDRPFDCWRAPWGMRATAAVLSLLMTSSQLAGNPVLPSTPAERRRPPRSRLRRGCARRVRH